MWNSNYVAVSKPFLRHRHIVARKQWANVHREWGMCEWGKVIFSDESTFTIKPAALRKRVWRKKGERYRTVNLVPTFKSGYQSISVWAAFSLYGRTPLVRIEGNLNQQKYVTILKEHLLPYAKTYHSGTNLCIFQQDGCGLHRAKSIGSFMEAECVELLPWPAQSPDLNPIENAWALMKRNLREHDTYPTFAVDLFEKLSELWNSIPSSYFERLIESMTSRVIELEKARGLSTRY